VQQEATDESSQVEWIRADYDPLIPLLFLYAVVANALNVEESFEKKSDNGHLKDEGKDALANDAVQFARARRLQESQETCAVDVFFQTDLDFFLFVLDLVCELKVFLHHFFSFIFQFFGLLFELVCFFLLDIFNVFFRVLVNLHEHFKLALTDYVSTLDLAIAF
jgi:hypothetical protein